MLEGGQRPGRLRTGRGGRADLPAADLPGHAGAAVEDGRRGLPPRRDGAAPTASEVLSGWLAQAMSNRRRLLELLAAVHRYRIPSPRGTQESLVEYDRRRSIKETLLEQIIAATVETADAGRLIRGLMGGPPPAADAGPLGAAGREMLRALLRGDAAAIRRQWRALVAALSQQPLLYVALARGGNPLRIVASRSLQGMLRRLLGYLPRLGLLAETTS